MTNEGFYKARGKGVPRTDVERVAAHYNISESEAGRWLNIHPIDELLPPRGTGLTSGRGAGSVTNNGESSGESEVWKIAVGTLVGGAIGAALGYLIRG